MFLLSLTHFSYQSLLFPYFLVFLPFSHFLLTIFVISTIIFEPMMPRALFGAPSLYLLGPSRHFNSAVLQSPPVQHVSEFIIFFPKLVLHFVSIQWPHHSLGEPDWCTFFSPLSLVPMPVSPLAADSGHFVFETSLHLTHIPLPHRHSSCSDLLKVPSGL